MGSVFSKRSAPAQDTLERQIREREEYAANMRAQLSIKCHQDKSPEACHKLGEFFLSFDRNLDKSKETLNANCYDHGFGESCLLLGQLSLAMEGEPHRDVPAALKHFQQACKLEVGGGCTMTGIVHGMGIDNVVPVSLSKAAEFFQRGCNLDDKVGCFQGALIARYAPTPDVVADFKTALQMFGKGCRLGSLVSCTEAGDMYEKGIGTPVDAEKANECYEKVLFRSS